MYHVPILLRACIDALDVRADGVYFDGTLGGGGHSFEILRRGGRLVATDRDDEAIAYADKRFADAGFTGRYTLVKSNFKDAAEQLDFMGIPALDGAILDLGVSSHQLDDRTRGFSYMGDERLDMRMDRSQKLTAEDVVNSYDEDELIKILFGYGEERFARRIAHAIAETRKQRRIETTGQLAELVKRNLPYQKGGHPAKRTFQAIRIEVNGELDGLGDAVEGLIDRLKSGARLAVITFHSLEDRIVKQRFKQLATGCICDKSLPMCVCGHRETVKLLKKIKPDEAETSENPRAKSATLRIAEKL